MEAAHIAYMLKLRAEEHLAKTGKPPTRLELENYRRCTLAYLRLHDKIKDWCLPPQTAAYGDPIISTHRWDPEEGPLERWLVNLCKVLHPESVQITKCTGDPESPSFVQIELTRHAPRVDRGLDTRIE